jgi:3-hydroxyisobutyrate dehydrogenase
VGWIGLGAMGAPLAAHVAAAGFELAVWSRSGRGLERVPGAGAVAGPSGVAAAADVVVTMLGGPDDVREVWGELLAAARPGQIFVDLTTSSARLAARWAEQAVDAGAAALDAPVTGGRGGAEAATLDLMVGGDRAALQTARPVLASFSSAIRHFGAPGRGQLAKAVNQLAVAGVMQGLAEALALARAAGLPRETMLETLARGTARSFLLDAYGARMLAGDRTPGFAVETFAKDLRLAEAASVEHGLGAPGAAATRALYEALDAAGRGGEGIQTLIDALDDH